MSKKADLLKALPYLKGRKVEINGGHYTGIVTGWTDRYVDLKELQINDGQSHYAYSLFFATIDTIKILP